MSRRQTRNAETRHAPREEETRAETWTPPAILDAPTAREGFKQRWIATQIQGKDVPHQVMRRFREGWVPRPADTIPESFQMPTIAHGTHEGCVGVEGMLLCEMPVERLKARERYFAGKTGELNQFVDQQLDNVERAGGHKIEREFESSVTNARPAYVAEDD